MSSLIDRLVRRTGRGRDVQILREQYESLKEKLTKVNDLIVSQGQEIDRLKDRTMESMPAANTYKLFGRVSSVEWTEDGDSIIITLCGVEK